MKKKSTSHKVIETLAIVLPPLLAFMDVYIFGDPYNSTKLFSFILDLIFAYIIAYFAKKAILKIWV